MGANTITISLLADYLGIISFCMTIVLLIYSESLRKQIQFQKEDFKKEQKAIRIALMGFRQNIWEDNLLTLQIRSEIRTNLITYKQNYKYVLSLSDKTRIRKTISILSKDEHHIDIAVLCEHLDYLIARFAKKEK